MKKWILAGTFCAFAAMACDKDDDNKTDELNDTDRTFVAMASISNNAEITAAQAALAKGTSGAVKAYAQEMIDEHTLAQQDLKTRASAVSLNAADTVDAEHQLEAARLYSLSGYSFDTAYINGQLRDHGKTLGIFDTEINGGQHQSIRSYATQYQPHIQMHYNKADSIRQTL